MVVKAPITHRGGFEAKPPTVMLHLNKDFEVGGDGPSKQHPDSLEAIPSGSAGRLVRLSPLNCVFTIGHSVCQAFFWVFDAILYLDHVELHVYLRCFKVRFAPDLALHSDSLDISTTH